MKASVESKERIGSPGRSACRLAWSAAAGVAAVTALLATTPALAAKTPVSDVDIKCDGIFEFDKAQKKCVASAANLAKNASKPACEAVTGLKWDAATSSCKVEKAPAPRCVPATWNISYDAEANACVVESSPDSAKAKDFFADWATGIAIVKPRVKTVTDAAVVPATAASGVTPTVRVNSEVRNESSILVARHFHPWNPGRRCAEGGRFTTKEGDEALTAPITGFFASCTGMVIAAGLPTSGAVNGQILNFLGIGFSIGSGPTNETNPTAWHLGYGWGRKFNTRVLGDGWTENAPPPDGETQVRYKYIDVPARFLYFTVHW